MHNNFLVERSGKMSKSSGEFLRLQLLIDKGYHPLAYRLMCLQAHYRSELEFSWEGLGAALVRLKRLVMGVEKLLKQPRNNTAIEPYTINEPPQPPVPLGHFNSFNSAIAEDLNTPDALTAVEAVIANLGNVKLGVDSQMSLLATFDGVLGLNLLSATRTDLRIRPKSATLTEAEIEAKLAARKEARTAKDFATSDRLRDELAAQGVEVMDGDPLGWEWKLGD